MFVNYKAFQLLSLETLALHSYRMPGTLPQAWEHSLGVL